MQKMHKWYSKRVRQTAPMLGADQVKMRSGGYGWQLTDWARLDRFLILGTEGGTYYVSEQKLTRQSAEAVLRCVAEDGQRVVRQVVEISQAGRAPKNDPALFVLAICAKLGDEATKTAAYKALPDVARIGTHLFHFAEYCKAFGGLGGNGFKRAIGRWYTQKDARRLALQAVKYQQRDGWSHRDLLRLSHVSAGTDAQQAIFEWIVSGWSGEVGSVGDVPTDLQLIWAFEKAKGADKASTLVKLIGDHRLPHECVPNAFKQDARVWQALLQKMPLGAMLRNLNKMTAVGLLSNSSDATKLVVSNLTNAESLARARLHPLTILLALKTYAAGRGFRGSLSWAPVGHIVDALDRAFYLAFKSVEPTGKRLCLALDVSGSMSAAVSGTRFVSCREAAAAMALVAANVEPNYEMLAFASGGKGNVQLGKTNGWATGVTPLSITARMRLDSVVERMSALPFGGTDCALPMRWALKTRTEVDCFVIYTDNESWAGDVHVDQALNDYRQRMGIPAKLVAVALSGDRFSVANPNDAYQMDVVGFDTATPNVINDFIAG